MAGSFPRTILEDMRFGFLILAAASVEGAGALLLTGTAIGLGIGFPLKSYGETEVPTDSAMETATVRLGPLGGALSITF